MTEIVKKGARKGVGDGGGIPLISNVLVEPPPSSPSITWGIGSDNIVRVRVGERLFEFTWRQALYLNAVAKCENVEDFEKIGRGMGISKKVASKWLGGVGAREFLSWKSCGLIKKVIYGEEQWFDDMLAIFLGERKVSKNELEAGKELGMRLSPKIEKVRHEFEDIDFIFTAKRSEQ